MPSDRKKKAAAAKAAKAKAPASKAQADGAEEVDQDTAEDGSTAGPSLQGSTANLQGMEASASAGGAASAAEQKDSGRSCTGVLTSHPMSRDVKIESFTLLYHGHELLQDACLELNHGR